MLLDLGLPDATGLDGLREILCLAPHIAVVVLTGLGDVGQGAAAVAAGAQDYLVKGEADSAVLSRSIRYAVERTRAEESSRLLLEADLRREHNTRLERGLLPDLLIDDPSLRAATRYRPGGGRSLLGGDFYDAVELADGTLRLVIGDVSGHGPDEAALGVNLRIAWRTLVLAGHRPAEVLSILDQLLCRERRDDFTFTTLADLSLAPDRHSVSLRLAGHPRPAHAGRRRRRSSGRPPRPAARRGRRRRLAWPRHRPAGVVVAAPLHRRPSRAWSGGKENASASRAWRPRPPSSPSAGRAWRSSMPYWPGPRS